MAGPSQAPLTGQRPEPASTDSLAVTSRIRGYGPPAFQELSWTTYSDSKPRELKRSNGASLRETPNCSSLGSPWTPALGSPLDLRQVASFGLALVAEGLGHGDLGSSAPFLELPRRSLWDGSHELLLKGREAAARTLALRCVLDQLLGYANLQQQSLVCKLSLSGLVATVLLSNYRSCSRTTHYSHRAFVACSTVSCRRTRRHGNFPSFWSLALARVETRAFPCVSVLDSHLPS